MFIDKLVFNLDEILLYSSLLILPEFTFSVILLYDFIRNRISIIPNTLHTKVSINIRALASDNIIPIPTSEVLENLKHRWITNVIENKTIPIKLKIGLVLIFMIFPSFGQFHLTSYWRTPEIINILHVREIPIQSCMGWHDSLWNSETLCLSVRNKALCPDCSHSSKIKNPSRRGSWFGSKYYRSITCFYYKEFPFNQSSHPATDSTIKETPS